MKFNHKDAAQVFSHGESSIFIGNNFTDAQLLFVIPFAEGYAMQKNIKKIIFDQPLPIAVEKKPFIKNILKKYQIYCQPKSPKLTSRLKLMYLAARFFFPLISLTKKTTRSGLMEKVSWYESQLRHAVWDTTLNRSKDGFLYFSLINRFASALFVFAAVKNTSELLDKHSIKLAILGHSVYAGRGVLAEFQRRGIHIVAHANNVLYQITNYSNNSWGMMPCVDWNLLITCVDKLEVQAYWKQRLMGKSSYADAERAANSQKLVSLKTPKNIIFLHVFRDSPFNYIDRDRIFADYIHWIEETLSIIAESNESWLIKLHPSAKLWGEDQMLWLKSIGRCVFGDYWPPNIEIDKLDHSNIDLITHAKRVVTFHGTVHLETACCGVKPIVISEVSLSSYNSNLVCKPASLNEYKLLLLSSEKLISFRLSSKEQNDAKHLLFIRENVLSFGKDVGSTHIYRGESAAAHMEVFESMSDKIDNFSDNLVAIGVAMANGISRSTRFCYFKRWLDASLSL